MSVRERFEQLCADWSLNMHGPDLLEILDDAGLRVIEQPEAPYDLVAEGPRWWIGDYVVVAHANGAVVCATGDDEWVEDLPSEVVAAISAAHIRADDY